MKKTANYRKRNKLIGLKRHTHTQRSRLLKKTIIPMLRKELGKNLVAIAADGSYARHEDSGYSDLELMIFVKDKSHLPYGFSKIHNGMLIEGLFVTAKDYHKMIHEPNNEWYIAGSDTLLPITNPQYIRKLKKYQVKHLAQKCDGIALDMLNEIQESFGKLLNSIDRKNHENLYIVLSDAVMGVLKLLAYMNRRPYKSLNSIITEARTFKRKPEGLDKFLDLVVQGKYRNLAALRKSARQLYLGIEDYFFKKHSNNIYDGDLSSINKKTKKRR